MDKKLELKDLINIGMFTAIYFVCIFISGMIGFIPVLLVLLPFLGPLVGGIPFMLYMTKIKKFGMITITGIICGLLMMLTGHMWTVIVFCVLLGLLADVILKIGKYKSWKCTVISYAVFSEWVMGGMLPIFFMRNSYFETLESGYGAQYAETVKNITPTWMFFVMIGLVIIGSISGAMLGRKVMNKHFKKAGII